MDITYLGHSCFRIRGKEKVVVTDPFDPDMVGLKLPKLTGDIVTISHDHQDHNRADLVTGVKKMINGPGEYEILGVSIIGISSFHDDKKGSLRGKNTIYIIEIDGLRITHLGDLGHTLGDSVLEDIGTIDVLMIPVGGEYTIGPEVAREIVRGIEPVFVIPMHYQTPGLNPKTFASLAKVEEFTGDLGLPVDRLDKLTVRKESLGEEQRVIVLERKS